VFCVSVKVKLSVYYKV